LQIANSSNGDPAHVEVPLQQLLSKDMRVLRAGVDWKKMHRWKFVRAIRWGAMLFYRGRHDWAARGGGLNVHVAAFDREGFVAAFTPSGAWLRAAEIVPSLVFPAWNADIKFSAWTRAHPNMSRH